MAVAVQADRGGPRRRSPARGRGCGAPARRRGRRWPARAPRRGPRAPRGFPGGAGRRRRSAHSRARSGCDPRLRAARAGPAARALRARWRRPRAPAACSRQRRGAEERPRDAARASCDDRGLTWSNWCSASLPRSAPRRLYSLGIALQAMDAKRGAARRSTCARRWCRPAPARALAARARGCRCSGWPLQVLALLLAPLVVVQPALAAGLIVLLVVAERMLDEPRGGTSTSRWRAIVVGVSAPGCARRRAAPTHTSEDLTITLVLVGLGRREPAALHAARAAAARRAAIDDARRGAGVRLERGGDEARLRRPRAAAICCRRAPVGAVDRGGVGAWACSAR